MFKKESIVFVGIMKAEQKLLNILKIHALWAKPLKFSIVLGIVLRLVLGNHRKKLVYELLGSVCHNKSSMAAPEKLAFVFTKGFKTDLDLIRDYLKPKS